MIIFVAALQNIPSEIDDSVESWTVQDSSRALFYIKLPPNLGYDQSGGHPMYLGEP